ncbi:MAG: hypothetical protein KY463_14335, partial [Actinobacteria bacterium]|nr:hypothetical protein [Actinomycetota bacterium]
MTTVQPTPVVPDPPRAAGAAGPAPAGAASAISPLRAQPAAVTAMTGQFRVVYGAVSKDAWRELGETGALRRLDLIEWIDASVPEHRRTLRVASRVLALVHGEVALDRELASCATLD